MSDERARLDLKKTVAACAWTAALALAVVRSYFGHPSLTVWTALLATLAACATVGLMLDYVCHSAVTHMLEQMRAERHATVQQAVSASHVNTEKIANQLVERLSNKQDKTVERIAKELVAAMGAEQPTGPHRIT